jgi:recombination protein RecA
MKTTYSGRDSSNERARSKSGDGVALRQGEFRIRRRTKRRLQGFSACFPAACTLQTADPGPMHGLRRGHMTEKNTKKENLDAAVAAVEKEFGKGAIQRLGDGVGPAWPNVIPSGSLALDEALGIGGYPRGRIVEVFGPESSGKTTLTLHAIANVQRAGGTAAFIDAEHAFDLNYAKGIGVDTSKLLVAQPDYGEQALEITDMLTCSGAVDLIVIDSVAALVPKAELDGDMGDNHMGLHARLMSQAMRKITGSAKKTETTVMLINQLRQKIGVVFGNPETTTGGQALKFYSSMRLDVRRIGKVTAGETLIGNRTKVKVIKNKCASPFAEAEFDIRWGIGVDALTDLLDVADACAVVAKNGAHYAFAGKNFAQGRDRARDALLATPELMKAIRTEVLQALPTLATRSVMAAPAASAPPPASPPAKRAA